MKRPISILCLADIHYGNPEDMGMMDSFYQEVIKYIDGEKSRIKWMPDYIVIAGDVVDKNGKYDQVKKFIDHLLLKNVFNIAPDHVIVVPGNHDKKAVRSKKSLIKEVAVFDNYCEKSCNDTIRAFGNVYYHRFKDFIKFSEGYTCDLQHIGKGNNCLLDKRLRCLSGVKVFNEDHICFLYVNTEWLYEPGRDKAQIVHNNINYSNYFRLDENCKLCAPLIKDACSLIKKNYPAYTVITVMHRGFDHLSWEENNPSDAAIIDAIGYLLKTSDIIISGHDHVFSPAPPTLINNSVQHFQLGAVGRKESPTKEYQRSAEIIRVDVPNETVEQLFIEYKNSSSGFCWSFEEASRKYPLQSRYLSRRDPSTTISDHRDTILRAQSSSIVDIKQSITSYFDLPSSFSLKIVAADRDLEAEIDSIVKNRDGNRLFIVVYYYYHAYNMGINAQDSLIQKAKRQIETMRDRLIQEQLSGQVYIYEIIIEYPLVDN